MHAESLPIPFRSGLLQASKTPDGVRLLSLAFFSSDRRKLILLYIAPHLTSSVLNLGITCIRDRLALEANSTTKAQEMVQATRFSIGV